jgi:hypothetical protein
MIFAYTILRFEHFYIFMWIFMGFRGTHLHVVFVPLYRGLGCAEDLDLELHPLVLQGDRVVQHQHEVRSDLQWVLLKIQ